jgi:hypothetical protein
MIEAAFGAAAVTLAGGADRRSPCRRATRRRAIGVAAITRAADRKQPIAASTDLLAKRRVHDVGAAARFDWTRRSNRGTRTTTGSVRRSIEAVTEGLKLPSSGLHLNPPHVRQPTVIQPFRGGARRQLLPSIGVVATAAERLQGPPMTDERERDSDEVWARRRSRYKRFQVSADTRALARKPSTTGVL